MLNEVEWCLGGDRDDLEVVWVEEDIPNKHLQSLHLVKPQVVSKVTVSAAVALADEAAASEAASEAASMVIEEGLVDVEVLATRVEVDLEVVKADTAVVLPKVLRVVRAAEEATEAQIAMRIEKMAMAEVGMVDETAVDRREVIENLLADEIVAMKTETGMVEVVVAEETTTTDREGDLTRAMDMTIRESEGTE